MPAATDVSALRGVLDQAPRPIVPPDTRLAGVLVPLVAPAGSLVFTRRAEHLSRHAGEISFPGGLLHEEDEDVRAAALRETQEELGVDPSSVEVLGALEPVHTTVSAILIVPFVGVLSERPPLTPNPEEIAEVLEFSITALERTETTVRMRRDGREYRGYAYDMPEATVWGATARIVHALLRAMRRGAR